MGLPRHKKRALVVMVTDGKCRYSRENVTRAQSNVAEGAQEEDFFPECVSNISEASGRSEVPNEILNYRCVWLLLN